MHIIVQDADFIYLHYDLYHFNKQHTVIIIQVLIVWFNDCALGKSGQNANPIIVMVNPAFEQEISNIYPQQLKLKRPQKLIAGFHI